jgi:uncharacterized protein
MRLKLINFEEAKIVFADSKHSDHEERYIDIGLSSKGQLLVVIYTEHQSNIYI